MLKRTALAALFLAVSAFGAMAWTDHWNARLSMIRYHVSVLGPGRSVWLGDSNTESIWWNTACGDFVVNAGFGGARVADILTYLPHILADTRPSVVVVMIGTNDAKRQGPGLPADPATVAAFPARFNQILDQIAAAGAQAAVLTVLPVELNKSLGHAYFDSDAIRAFNAHIRAEAARRNLPIVDTYKAYAGVDGYMLPGWTYDGVHIQGVPGNSPRHRLYYLFVDATRQARARIGKSC